MLVVGNFTVCSIHYTGEPRQGEVVVSALRLDCVVYLIEAGDDPNSWAHTADSTRIVPVVLLALLLGGSCLDVLWSVACVKLHSLNSILVVCGGLAGIQDDELQTHSQGELRSRRPYAAPSLGRCQPFPPSPISLVFLYPPNSCISMAGECVSFLIVWERKEEGCGEGVDGTMNDSLEDQIFDITLPLLLSACVGVVSGRCLGPCGINKIMWWWIQHDQTPPPPATHSHTHTRTLTQPKSHTGCCPSSGGAARCSNNVGLGPSRDGTG
jgi:hypothetical protein